MCLVPGSLATRKAAKTMGKTREANAQNAKAEAKVEGVINSRKTHKENAGKLKTLLTFKGKCSSENAICN